MKKLLIILLTTLTIVSCGSQQPTTRTITGSPMPAKGQIWQLTVINNRDIATEAKTTTLTFNPEAGSFRGQTACNSYAGAGIIGEAAADGRRPFIIKLLTPGSVRCPEADMNAEERFLSTLKKANHILINEHSLTLYHDNKEILHFELQ